MYTHVIITLWLGDLQQLEPHLRVPCKGVGCLAAAELLHKLQALFRAVCYDEPLHGFLGRRMDLANIQRSEVYYRMETMS